MSHPDLNKGEKQEKLKNKNNLKINDTIADQYIRLPNDLSLTKPTSRSLPWLTNIKSSDQRNHFRT